MIHFFIDDKIVGKNIQLDMHGLKSFNCVNSHQEVITKVLSFPGR